MRYSRVIGARAAATLSELPDGVEYVHAPARTDDIGDNVDGNVVLAIVTDMCRTNFGRALNPLRVAFHHPPPADAGTLRSVLRLPGVCSAPMPTACAISRADADYPLPTGNRQLAACTIASWRTNWPASTGTTSWRVLALRSSNA